MGCLELAEDSRGRRIRFGNTGFSGGLDWCYADDPEAGESDCGQVGCLIHGRPVLVTEARFGGVVAQPIGRAQLLSLLRSRGVNLTPWS